MSGQPSSPAHQGTTAGELPRFWPEALRGKWGKTLAWAAFAFLNGGISIALLALLAHWTDSPMVFPSLGPTAFLLFHRPLAPAACPRNTVLGHLIGLAVGWGSLVLFGLTDVTPDLQEGVGWLRVAAAALSLGGTSGLMVLLGVPHPPAGATTMIVSLGLMHQPWQLPILLAGVVLLLVQGLLINRLAGIPYPLWGPAETAP